MLDWVQEHQLTFLIGAPTNLAMLTALGKPAELKLHVKGALTNGVTVAEIKEVLLQASVYCGIPAGLEAFRAADEVLLAEGAISPRDGSE